VAGEQAVVVGAGQELVVDLGLEVLDGAHDPAGDAAQALLGVGEREVGDHEPAAGLQGGQDVGADQVDVAALVHGDVVDDQRRRPVHPELLEGAADELDPVGQAGPGDQPAGQLDRVGVAVDPDDLAGREVLGQSAFASVPRPAAALT
jgi:hypothetical protein